MHAINFLDLYSSFVAVFTWPFFALGYLHTGSKYRFPGYKAIAGPFSIEKTFEGKLRYSLEPINQAQVLIYSTCLFTVSCLFFAFSCLDCWRTAFICPTSFVVTGGNSLLAYLLLAILLVAPCFYLTEVLLQSKRTKRSVFRSLFSINAVIHAVFFLALPFYVVPLVEACRSGLNLSHYLTQQVKYFVMMSTIFGTFPVFAIIPLAMCKQLMPLFKPNQDQFFLGDLSTHIHLIQAQKLDLAALDSRTDSEVTAIIDTARMMCEMEKADQISNYLVSRHLMTDAVDWRQN